ncbi:alpha-1,2-mannosidase [Fibrisoma limi BUZ 3]|uniref:Alpha-1,2-mannosidase n=1 Tax=Fibrisoma limi BUZ 3 TaxID=1185876 RepID=I2GKG4_9BACT|nr:GH92 family glycosyl hydrolase [Fibrisoma limi]CCH54389.1 alpha-1,2-mannosidase [Fibrisoma limi BUZ 3]
MQLLTHYLLKTTFPVWILCVLLITHPMYAQKRPVAYVNPLIGSAPSQTPTARKHSEAGSELKGQIVPAIGQPHAMTTWTPQTQATETKCIAPYYYNDTKINGFRGTHWLNGSCVQDYGSLTIMPIAGTLALRPAERGSRFNHATETVTPAYYDVRLTDSDIRAEISAHTRAGLLQFTFGKGGESAILIEPNSDEGEGYVEIHPERNEIVGYNPVHRIYQGAGQSAGFSGYFVVQFDRPLVKVGTWTNYEAREGQRQAKGGGRREAVGAYVGWNLRPGEVVRVRVGTSFVDEAGARKNLESEINHWDLARVRQQTEAAWNAELSRMQARGSDTDKTLFYTALYHANLTPRIFSDVDGRYPGFAEDTTIRRAEGFTYYCDFSLWDTFRACQPLQNLLNPQRSGEMMQSLVKKAEQGGWMPIFPCWNSYTAAMIGDHAQSAVADAYVKGIRNFDVKTAYRYLRQNAFDVNKDPKSYESGKGRRALASYLQYNYIPLEDSVWQAFHKREQVSRTLEYAYDDFCLSQLAKALGHADDQQALTKRAMNYRNVLDPKTGYVRGRYANGNWVDRFNPFALRASFITEGSPAQYTYFVPQDVAGLIEGIGGRQRFVAKLDTLFEGGYYWHGNEPNNQIVYLYAYAGAPWQTQARVRQIVREEYSTGPGGLSGNEDGGQMSAWLAFSMAGIYPVCPGTPYYVLGSPSLDAVTINPPSGKPFRILARNNSEQNVYIQSATLNGKPFTRTYLSHDEILNGGELVLQMGPQPNKNWGSRPADAPPSLSQAGTRP